MDEMGKKFDKTAKNNAVTYIMVIVAWLVMMALQQAGMLNSSTTGLLVPVCIYSIMAVSLNLTVGILGGRSLCKRILYESGAGFHHLYSVTLYPGDSDRCSGGGCVWSADRYSGSPLKR